MDTERNIKVAVLLATYNGSRYIDPQLRSLKENSVPFTLHWLDDHSSDDTRGAVRTAALSAGIRLHEWRDTEHHGVPGSYFRLLEQVEADIYLFCDQDDIWEPGKIDATVGSLLPDSTSPALCFTDLLIFRDSEPGVLQRMYDFGPDGNVASLLGESKMCMFMPGCASAQTQGFTRPLRDIFLKHKSTAQTYAAMHDWWMYDMAIASGVVRMLPNAPRVLCRRGHESFTTGLYPKTGHRLARTWRTYQWVRRITSRHARGVILATETLPPGPRLQRVLEPARLVALLDRRQSPAAAVRLARYGRITVRGRLPMALISLFTDAQS